MQSSNIKEPILLNLDYVNSIREYLKWSLNINITEVSVCHSTFRSCVTDARVLRSYILAQCRPLLDMAVSELSKYGIALLSLQNIGRSLASPPSALELPTDDSKGHELGAQHPACTNTMLATANH